MNTQNLEQKARDALDNLDKVTRHGADSELIDKDALQYGLEHGLFDQGAVNDAQERYKRLLYYP